VAVGSAYGLSAPCAASARGALVEFDVNKGGNRLT